MVAEVSFCKLPQFYSYYLGQKKVIFNVSYKTIWSRSRKKYFWAPQHFTRQQDMPQDLANEELQGSLASEALALLSGSTGAPATADSVLDSGRQQTGVTITLFFSVLDFPCTCKGTGSHEISFKNFDKNLQNYCKLK